ncbi:hypothetical protein GIB67_030174 [Kingdonia uniflora]|uniref:Uncharacterized protein n=1 Tax=Kingdonia uniflora TaxID=39325 RepID=A0A7J7LEA6_9MAGN|nr:hypothetical protein GIB67_030174 [Kingdonia uniflora]
MGVMGRYPKLIKNPYVKSMLGLVLCILIITVKSRTDEISHAQPWTKLYSLQSLRRIFFVSSRSATKSSYDECALSEVSFVLPST